MAKTLMIPRELLTAAARIRAYLSLADVKLSSGRTRSLVTCELRPGGHRHEYVVDCGTPTTQKALAQNLADALGRYAVVNDADKLSDGYFRSHAACQRSDADVTLFEEARLWGRDVHEMAEDVARLAAQVAYGDPDAVVGVRERPLVDRLADAADEFVEALDGEFDVGRYEAPDAVPLDYDGEDYYADYQKAVDRAVGARMKLRKLVAEADGSDARERQEY